MERAETRERYPGGCPTGSAVITGAGNLAARFVIHAVGPVWNGGRSGEKDKLSQAYQSSLELAVDHSCSSLAFPSLSTGAYRYPLDLAAATALKSVLDFLERQQALELVRFVLFDDKTFESYAAALEHLRPQVNPKTDRS